MVTAKGIWGIWNTGACFEVHFPCGQARKARSSEPKKQRKHHYTFDVDDNGLDINGFILHTDKHKGKRHKFRVYLDSNENNRFDKDDVLLGRSGLKTRHSKNGAGGILDEDELGQLEIKFKKPKSNASMRGTGGDALVDYLMNQEANQTINQENEKIENQINENIETQENKILNNHLQMSFTHPDGSEVADFYDPSGMPVQGQGENISSYYY